MPTKKRKKRRVTFSLTAPGVMGVCLTGSFNNWNLDSHHMKQGSDGVWTRTVIIPPGTYEYKYLVGGEWWHDPLNQNVAYNEYGTLNSVIVVE
ncbi:MAG: glycoside hydrolase [Deltaproteobacteria bacterium]|jgi:5'-AMP-activated protein kinase regulatory beta subunit|nr:glycoside hydrolase [Deltaproteobacteria bacterium]